jgi:hypothetical protein
MACVSGRQFARSFADPRRFALAAGHFFRREFPASDTSRDIGVMRLFATVAEEPGPLAHDLRANEGIGISAHDDGP